MTSRRLTPHSARRLQSHHLNARQYLPDRDLVFIGMSDRLWSVDVSQKPRLPLNRAADSEEPLPSPGLSGWLMLGVVSQPRCPRSFQCAGPVGTPRVVLLHI